MARTIGKLKETRERRFMTQAELADAADVTVRTISHAENNGEVSVRVIKLLADALKVKPEALL